MIGWPMTHGRDRRNGVDSPDWTEKDVGCLAQRLVSFEPGEGEL